MEKQTVKADRQSGFINTVTYVVKMDKKKNDKETKKNYKRNNCFQNHKNNFSFFLSDPPLISQLPRTSENTLIHLNYSDSCLCTII